MHTETVILLENYSLGLIILCIVNNVFNSTFVNVCFFFLSKNAFLTFHILEINGFYIYCIPPIVSATLTK